MAQTVTTTDYGTDVSCTTGLDPYFSLVSGPEAVAQALARRLQTPLGGLLTDPTYGFDLRGLLNSGLTGADILAAQTGIEEQCLYDERVDSVEVSVSLNSLTGVCTVSVVPTLVEGETFTLTFVLDANNLTLAYEGVECPT